MRPKRLLTLPLALALACGIITGPAEREFDRARDRWRGRAITSYDFTVERFCFCPEEIIKPMRIEVRNGQVVSAKSAATGASYDLQWGTTIDKIFDDIAETLDKGKVIEVSYDATYGYPIEANLDRIKNAIDDEVTYKLSAFTPR